MHRFAQVRCHWRRRAPGKGALEVGCWLAGVMVAGSAAQGQEALFSALGLDSALAQHNAADNLSSALVPGQSHWGPVNFTLGAYAGTEANDNINLSASGTQSDTIIQAGLSVGLVWPATEQSDLSFNATAGYDKYLSHPGNDRVEIAPGSVLNWKIAFEDGSLTAFDQFSDSQAVISEASVSGVSALPRIDNTIGARGEWQPGRWLFALGYSHDNYFSDDATYQYLNRASEYLFFRGAHRLAEDTQLGLEASASFTKYDQAIQSDNSSYSAGPYLEWQITHFLDASARGGYTIYAFDAGGSRRPAQNLNSYYFHVELTHQLMECVSHGLSIQRDVSLGLNQGNNYTEQLTANYFVNWAATDHLGVHLTLTYEEGNQPLAGKINTPFGSFPVSQNENYSRVGLSPAISYQLTRKLSGSLTCAHWERTSNRSGEYRDNSVSLQLNYMF